VKTRVSSEGQIVLPAEVRRQDRIVVGQEFEFERLGRGEYRLVRRASPPNAGVVDWLLACPEKGFFAPVESTLAVVTRNVADFEKAGCDVVNPFDARADVRS
jgi:bifunctional DNA-binding transcriptional regulator/antitoxin component of YhaV-PrlF toxin-antitoxin module